MELATNRLIHGCAEEGGGLLHDHSLEMTARDVPQLREAASLIAPGTRISVAFLPGEDAASRLEAAATVRRLGFVPIPHISARRIESTREMENFVRALVGEAGVEHVLLVAGDRSRPLGPYDDTLAVIRSGVLHHAGIRHASIAGYPEGHPSIPPEKLWRALLDKHVALADQGLDVSIITQFGFDGARVTAWLRELRGRGVDVPVRIGIPGPVSLTLLLRYASRCGVAVSTKTVGKFGVSLASLFGAAGPAALLTALDDALDPGLHGAVLVHFYSFGALARTAEWVSDFRRARHD
jgi:methylenetetrahydrofolate reductase (NADPH)